MKWLLVLLLSSSAWATTGGYTDPRLAVVYDGTCSPSLLRDLYSHNCVIDSAGLGGPYLPLSGGTVTGTTLLDTASGVGLQVQDSTDSGAIINIDPVDSYVTFLNNNLSMSTSAMNFYYSSHINSDGSVDFSQNYFRLDSNANLTINNSSSGSTQIYFDNGDGCEYMGQQTNGGFLNCNGNSGSLVVGSADGTHSQIQNGDVGSIAMGRAESGGTIESDNRGSLVAGYADGASSLLHTDGQGNIVMGSAKDANSTLYSEDDGGAMVFGYASGGGLIKASHSMTFGYENGGTLWANADRSFVFGEDFTNTVNDSFNVGFGQQDVSIVHGAINILGGDSINWSDGSQITNDNLGDLFINTPNNLNLNAVDVTMINGSSFLWTDNAQISSDSSGDLIFNNGNATIDSYGGFYNNLVTISSNGAIDTQAKLTIDPNGVINTGNAAGVPTLSGGGSGITFVSGSDVAGVVNVGTGGIATSFTVTFANSHVNQPACTANSQNQTLGLKVATSSTSLVITSSVPFTASSLINYICIFFDAGI